MGNHGRERTSPPLICLFIPGRPLRGRGLRRACAMGAAAKGDCAVQVPLRPLHVRSSMCLRSRLTWMRPVRAVPAVAEGQGGGGVARFSAGVVCGDGRHRHAAAHSRVGARPRLAARERLGGLRLYPLARLAGSRPRLPPRRAGQPRRSRALWPDRRVSPRALPRCAGRPSSRATPHDPTRTHSAVSLTRSPTRPPPPVRRQAARCAL